MRRLASLSKDEVKKKNEWLEWGKAISIAIILAFLLKAFVFSTSIVEGESMSPTLEDNNKIIFNKFVYLISKPKRGDIVIIQRPLKNYVKRVIALPGDKIQMIDHVLHINDEVSEQSFITDEAIMQTGNFGPTVVPDDFYYVMGDNRAISKDSRNGLGFIEEGNIIGRSEIIIYPFDQWSMTR